MTNATLTRTTGQKVIDWNRTEAHAKTLDREALWGAYLDCVKTAKVGMPQDAGYYMDCASVYRREFGRRNHV